MSGHSHAKNVKRIKESEDQRRSLVFSKMGKEISLAAKEGEDVEKNPTLKIAVEKAKKMNVPKENIEKAIKRGVDKFKDNLQDFIFEAYGPGGSALIVEGITDNINRISAEIKKTITQHGGKIANSGSVKWMFEKKGKIEIKCKESKDELELIILDSGAQDFKKENDYFFVFTHPENLNKTKNYIESKGYNVDSISFFWSPQNKMKLNDNDKKRLLKLVSSLEENEDVQKTYINLED